MSEVEQDAIEQLKKLLNDFDNEDISKTYLWVINKLIEKQQKEIEELKEKNKTLETLLQGTLYEMYLYYKDLASKYQANSISKDKIREKIKELEEYQKQHKQGNWTDIPIEDYDFDKINLLKELLKG